MPPPHACTVLLPVLTDPPAALQALYDGLQRGEALAAASAASIAAASTAAKPAPAHPPSEQQHVPSIDAYFSLVSLLSTPLSVSCQSCAGRVSALLASAGSPKEEEAEAALQLLTGDSDARDGVEQAGKSTDRIDAQLAVHTRVRLTGETPAFQLQFLRAIPLMLQAVDRKPTPSHAPQQLRTALRGLLHSYTRELDFRVDEEALLMRCHLNPPTAANFPDPLFPDSPAEGPHLYFPAPPRLQVSRLYGFHAPILQALHELADLEPAHFAPVELSQTQQRYFKGQSLATSLAADEMDELISLLKQQQFPATFVSTAAGESAREGEAAPFSPLLSTALAPAWLRFVPYSSEAESVLSAAEAAYDAARLERRRQRREKRDAELQRSDEAESKDVPVGPSKPLPVDEDDDIIMLSQAPNAAAPAPAAAETSPEKRARAGAAARRDSVDSSTGSKSASGASTPAAMEDPVEVAARRFFAGGGMAEWGAGELTVFPAFDEPDEFDADATGEQWAPANGDWWGSSQPAASQATSAPAVGSISLDEAFAEASQRVRQQASSQPNDDDTMDTGMEGEDAAVRAKPAPKSVSPPIAAASPSTSASPPPEPLLPQLDTLRSLLLSRPLVGAQPTVVVVLNSLLADGGTGSSAARTPASVLDALQSHPNLSPLSSQLSAIASICARFRECGSAAEFDAACARADLASLESAPSLLLFFALFLDAHLAHARVRTLLTAVVLPTLRAQLRSEKTSAGSKDATISLLSLLLRSYEDALVQSVLLPLLVDAMALDVAAAEGAGVFELLKPLLSAPPSAAKRFSSPGQPGAVASPVLASTVRLLLLQQFCVCSLQRFEHSRSGADNFRWSDAELQLLLVGFLDSSAGIALPPPLAEHHGALHALATGTSSIGSLLSALLPSGGSAGRGPVLALGDVGGLLLACMLLASANAAMRKQSGFALLMTSYAGGAGGSLSDSPLLQQATEALASQLGGVLGKRVKKLLTSKSA